MKARVCRCSLLLLLAGTLHAQQADSTRVQTADSLALQRFMEAVGPAEAVFSFGPTAFFRFKSGVYSIRDTHFPLLDSPDSLVSRPIEKAYKRHRRARITAYATAVPLVVLSYSAVRLVLSLGTVVSGRPSSAGLPSEGVLRASGIASVTGIALMGAFNISTTTSLFKGIRRHNKGFGRKLPTLFNPKGL
ncbi:hypothetical protein [Fibrella arboris]|uniref:hypothetical protein n=1 Tax=Fibrella arboris TaxID=3242486 RepID=UPI0035216534